MADSNFRGPVNSMGSLEVDAATAQVYPLDGPSMFYQGIAQPDIRSAPFAKDGFRAGQQLGWLAGGAIWTVDNIPQLRNTSLIATTQVGTAATAFPLATTQVAGVASAAGIAVGVPIIPLGTTTVTYVIALDFGFATGTTTTNSTAVAVVDNRYFSVGQWLIIGGCGNAAATRSHICQVTSIATANITGITVTPAVVTGIANVPIGQGNLFGDSVIALGTQFGPQTASASAHSFGGAFQAGLAKVVNPRETLTRNISMQSVTAQTMSGIVSGWDLWGNPMTELLALAAQTSMAGKKAFKYIGSFVPGTGSAGGSQAFSLGLGDTFGFPIRNDEMEQARVWWNGSGAGNYNGYSAAVTTPATSTTGDVRGTIQISTAILTGVLATSVSAVASNGTGRLAMFQYLGVWNQVAGNPVNSIPMFGVAQSTATT